MEFGGTVILVLPEQTGNGKNGVWVKREYIIEVGGQYPKKVCVTVWGDKLEKLVVGTKAEFHVELESREYNNKWYSEIKCWKFDIMTKSDSKKHPAQQAFVGESKEFNASAPNDFLSQEDDKSELPF